MKVLVVNCGSSSIKYQLYEMPGWTILAKGLVERIGESESSLVQDNGGEKHYREMPVADHEEAMLLILRSLTEGATQVVGSFNEIKAVGHRVVHGGEEFTGSVHINDDVIASIERYADLAPLHNPANLSGIRAAQNALPDIPQVACFDTAFHTTIPKVAYMYALPYELYEQYGIRRYGFHGTSHRWVARRSAKLFGRHKYDINCITCHLGNGCSITAVKDGRSIDTSMGLTPLEGLVMGTRSGSFDPAILFYLAEKGYDTNALKTLCNKKSGLLGISGISNDMRTLVEKAREDDDRAALAIDVFCYGIKKYIGAYAAAMGRVDAIVFTGGIGENSTYVREKICRGFEPLGIILDLLRNKQTVGVEGEISDASSRVKLLVIPTDEERAIAGDTYEIAMEKQKKK
ncbi:MAG: acetate kinase [Pirellulales bacterium]|nr:acetate kinase [Pirellulales bacterium]